MLKRRNDEATDALNIAKRRKQSQDLNEIVNPLDSNGLSQCFRRVRTRMHVYIAPAFSAEPIVGIQKQHLDPLLLHYSSDVSGVVVSYSNVKLLRKRGTSGPLGQIIGESPFSYYWIVVDLLVWSPQQGDVVEGWISVQSPGHVALLINDTFNASIKRAEIPESWTFVSQEDDETGSKSLGYWKDEQGNRIDGKLQFTVKRFLHEARTVLVIGSLLTADDVKPPQIDSKHKKFDSSLENGNGADNGNGNGNAEFRSEHDNNSSPVASKHATSKATPKKTKFED